MEKTSWILCSPFLLADLIRSRQGLNRSNLRNDARSDYPNSNPGFYAKLPGKLLLWVRLVAWRGPFILISKDFE
jgi:hypothetical protein